MADGGARDEGYMVSRALELLAGPEDRLADVQDDIRSGQECVLIKYKIKK